MSQSLFYETVQLYYLNGSNKEEYGANRIINKTNWHQL